MTIKDLILLTQNRLQTLNNKLSVLLQEGNSDSLVRVEEEIAQTESTLNLLASIGLVGS